MAIIVEPAHQPRVAFPRDACSVEPGGYGAEEILSLARQKCVDIGRAVGDRAVARILAVQDPQRILVEPRQAVFGQIGAMAHKMLDQRRAPGIAARRIAERVERQRHAFGDAKLLQKLVGEHQQFGIGERAVAADHFGVELVKLAVATLLRALVPEQRPVRRNLQRRELLPAIGDISARDAGGEFGAQRDRFAAAILERIHFLRHDVGRFAERAGEHRGRLDHRHLDALETIEAAHPVERVDDMRKAVGEIAEHVLGAAHRLGDADLCVFVLAHAPRV